MTPETCAKIAIDSLSNRPYPTAPVSDLYLYGHKQDLAFEKPTNDVQNRGHIRLWDTHTETNHEEVWIGSATYDHGIEIGSNTHLPTHHISPSVDKERDRVYQALRPYVRSEAVASFAQPNLFGKNGAVDCTTRTGIAVLSMQTFHQDQVSTSSWALTIKQRIFDWVSPLLDVFS